MGFLSFIKEAGEKIIAKKEEKKEDLLVKKINKVGLEIENMEIAIDDDTATVKGNVKDQATKEKIILIVGNSVGISKVDDQITVEGVEDKEEVETETKTETKKTQYYTVERGDTLGKIAKEFYSNAMKYPEILEANRPMLEDANKIYPGQVLRIPPLD